MPNNGFDLSSPVSWIRNLFSNSEQPSTSMSGFVSLPSNKYSLPNITTGQNNDGGIHITDFNNTPYTGTQNISGGLSIEPKTFTNPVIDNWKISSNSVAESLQRNEQNPLNDRKPGSNMYLYEDGSLTPMGYGSLALGGVQALTGLANAYLGYKNYKQAKDQFDFQKRLTYLNLDNQIADLRGSARNSANIAAALGGSNMSNSEKRGFVDNAANIDYKDSGFLRKGK